MGFVHGLYTTVLMPGVYYPMLYKEKKLKKSKVARISSISSRLAFLVAIFAIDRSGTIGFEGNFCFLPTVCAGYLVHFPWRSVIAPASKTSSFVLHTILLLFSYTKDL